MAVSDMAQLGKIAGLGGIALGAMVVILRAVLPHLGGVPVKQRATTYNLIIGGAFGIGALGIIAWTVGAPTSEPPKPAAATSGAQSPAIVGSGATVTYGQPPPAPARR